MRIVMAEDSALIREGLAGLLADRGHDVVARVDTVAALVASAEAAHPDLVLTDLRMPPTHTDEGVLAAERIRAAHPDAPVLVLSQHLDVDAALRLVALGDGVGYLMKDRVLDVGEFLAAMDRVVAGGTVLDPAVLRALTRRTAVREPLAALTARERDVLELMSHGRSNAAIARELLVAERTVETHVAAIFGKLGIAVSDDDNRRVRAVVTYLAARTTG